jgi:hypothetical protein
VVCKEDAEDIGDAGGDPCGAAADVTIARKTANPNEPMLRMPSWLSDYELLSRM